MLVFGFLDSLGDVVDAKGRWDEDVVLDSAG